ncbi:hypothetical protein [Actinophytocola sediminis]
MERASDDPFRMDFHFRAEDDAVVFLITTQLYDDKLSISQTHVAGFESGVLEVDATDDDVAAFLEENVLPAVFPYIQEGASAAASRVRPGKPINIGWNFQEPLDLKQD